MTLRYGWRNAILGAGAFAIMSTALPMATTAAPLEDFFSALFGAPPSQSSYASYSYRGGAQPPGYRVVTFSEKFKPGQIVVSFADRRLYYVAKPGRALSYPISVPRAQSRWQGTLPVSRKQVNPTWTPTAEMRRDNPRLPRVVPGGHPQNPLGYRAIYLGNTLYRIHGTDAPWTIGKAVSRGCVRMHNSDVADLYKRVRIGAKVTVTWQRFARS